MGAQPRESAAGVASQLSTLKGNIFDFFKVVIRQVCYIMGTPNASNSNNAFNVNSNGNVNYIIGQNNL